MRRLILLVACCIACATSRPVVVDPEPVDREELMPSGPPSDTITQYEVLSGISNARSALADCASGHRSRGGAKGRVLAKWRITTEGTTRDITLPTPSADKETNECFVMVLETLRFAPHPVEGGPVTFPFKL